MTRPTKWQRIKEWLSTGLCIVLVNGDADEMLSSWAWRNRDISNLYLWLDWIFGKDHCKESFEWEKQHYKVDRFNDTIQK